LVNQGLLNADILSVIAARKENAFCDYLNLLKESEGLVVMIGKIELVHVLQTSSNIIWM
jgi:hypothetical protein